jgi:predicted kinase
MLYIFSGLPGTGKTELSKFLAEELSAVYLRIDTIEQAMKEYEINVINGSGYHVAHKIAEDNLKTGLTVVSDSVNPLDFTRKDWRTVAIRISKPYCEIEVICSRKKEHKQRIETRRTEISGLILPNWEDVISREYHPWKSKHLVIDTAGKTPYESKQELLSLVSKFRK